MKVVRGGDPDKGVMLNIDRVAAVLMNDRIRRLSGTEILVKA